MGRARTTLRRETRGDLPSLDTLISEATLLSQRFSHSPMRARRFKLYVQLINDIDRRRKRDTHPSFADPVERDDHDWANGVREWFARASKMLPTNEYRRWVCHFGSKQLGSWKEGFGGLLFPPHRQDQLDYPFCLDEMPILEELTPRTGGRKTSLQVQDRNELIRKFRAEAKKKGLRGQVHRYVCQNLDEAKIPTLWPEFRSWTKAYRSDKSFRSRIDAIFSRA